MLKKDIQKIGHFFKTAREGAEKTQEQVAFFLGYSNKQIVSNWERGVCTPPLNQVARLVKFLNLDPNLVVELFLKASKAQLESLFETQQEKAKGKR